MELFTILILALFIYIVFEIIFIINYYNKKKSENHSINKPIFDNNKKTINYNSWCTIRKFINFDDFSNVCLQRKFITDENGNQQDLVKIDYKCVENNLSEWSITGKNDFYSIASAYDGKCLNYDPKNDKFYMQKCKMKNKFEDFTINNDIICSRIDKKKCLNDYGIYFVPSKPKEYQNLTCSIFFAFLGIKCCSNQNINVEYVDSIGNWGIENNELCGIGYTRCPFSVLGYDCCLSINTEVIRTDENGKWGMEDGHLCGIGEVTSNSKYYISNKKISQCLVTDKSNTDRILLDHCNGTNYNIWYIKDNQIISAVNNKCLYVNDSMEAALEECESINDRIDHYKHFDINDNGTICVKNHKEPKNNFV
ncbi:Non-catalytic module family DOC2 [Piromyces sp. E2]|nr:Non-catalytic module family DOC2 [Piromyces sp. E2]|eukprot:OUM58961.1 Non-catalytic module family DOC2 [Piromyces sp. E2]